MDKIQHCLKQYCNFYSSQKLITSPNSAFQNMSQFQPNPIAMALWQHCRRSSSFISNSIFHLIQSLAVSYLSEVSSIQPCSQLASITQMTYKITYFIFVNQGRNTRLKTKAIEGFCLMSLVNVQQNDYKVLMHYFSLTLSHFLTLPLLHCLREDVLHKKADLKRASF